MTGFAALLWFLTRIIPKRVGRATYPCQRAAFPLASAFIIWLTGIISSLFGLKYLSHAFAKHRWIVVGCSAATVLILSGWLSIMPGSITSVQQLPT